MDICIKTTKEEEINKLEEDKKNTHYLDEVILTQNNEYKLIFKEKAI